jgi:hypothetical protein
MRGYIIAIDRSEDSRIVLDFGSSIQNAGSWDDQRNAEVECLAFNIPGRITMHTRSRLPCSDFRVEQRAEGDFVISCEITQEGVTAAF